LVSCSLRGLDLPLTGQALTYFCRQESVPTKDRWIAEEKRKALADKIKQALRESTDLPGEDTKLMRILLNDCKELQDTLNKYLPDTFLSDDTADVLERIAATDKLCKLQRDLFKMINKIRARTAMMQIPYPKLERYYPYLTEREKEKLDKLRYEPKA
jgi:hypothetical protein